MLIFFIILLKECFDKYYGSSKIYSDNTNIKLVKAEDLDTVIAIASSYLSENGTVKLYESQDLIRRLN